MLSDRIQIFNTHKTPFADARQGRPDIRAAAGMARNLLLSLAMNFGLRFAPPMARRRARHAAPDRRAASALSPSYVEGPSKEAQLDGDELSKPRTFVDLTDVLCHAIWHDTCAGIPRVQLEVATRLCQSSPSVRVLAFHQKNWLELGALIEEANGDVDGTFALLKETFSDFKLGPKGLKLLWRKRRCQMCVPRHKRMPDIRSRDSLFIAGAFWINKEIIELCKRAAASDANLIVLFHDLIPLAMPSFTGHDFAQEYRDVLRLPAHFVVTTELNRSELKRARRQIDGNAQIASTVLPLADEFPGSRRGEPPRSPSKRLEALAGRDFALYVGTIEIRKNHHALIEVWSELAAERGASMPTLVIAGRRGWKAHATLARLDALAPGGPIIFIEAPTDNELRWLYASCLFTVFPSFFEGWGLPVGESFWFGKPCAASNATSIAPVARDLCALFSPYHREDMKSAISRLLNPMRAKPIERRIDASAFAQHGRNSPPTSRR